MLKVHGNLSSKAIFNYGPADNSFNFVESKNENHLIWESICFSESLS